MGKPPHSVNSSPTEHAGIRPNVKLLNSSEMALRKEKGLCFNCDERFLPGHKCKQRVYILMNPEEKFLFHSDEGLIDSLGHLDGGNLKLV